MSKAPRTHFLEQFKVAMKGYRRLNYNPVLLDSLEEFLFSNLRKNTMQVPPSQLVLWPDLWEGMTRAEIGAQRDLSANSVHKYAKLLSDALYSKFGFVLHIENPTELKSAVRALQYYSNSSSYEHLLKNFFGRGFLFEPEEGMPEFTGSIRECSNEIHFLARHSVEALIKDVAESNISPRKVMFLLKILSGEAGSAEDKSIVQHNVSGKFPYNPDVPGNELVNQYRDEMAKAQKKKEEKLAQEIKARAFEEALANPVITPSSAKEEGTSNA